ncbi:MAG: type I 3-dehydroquinate dehydratase [Phycisphaerales bacterium]|nr:type I 3-dehydroquinate dehydratase [Phycisphaerales bacterium]
MIAVPVTIDDPAQMGRAIERAEAARHGGADLVEWRVDALAAIGTSGHAAVQTLIAEAPLPSILTCRHACEGGSTAWSEDDRVELLRSLQDAPPTFFDLEHACWQGNDDLQHVASQLQAAGSKLILSCHDFDQRPPDLLRQVAQLGQTPCDVMKLAFHARSLREALECADLLAQRPKPMIALAMGTFGLISRVLSKAWGGLLTFASLDEVTCTAPGQPTLSQLVGQWGYGRVSRQTKVLGLIGWPLGASPGYEHHNAHFHAKEIDAVYLPLPVRFEWERFKADLIALIKHPEIPFVGASVTMPHKANCLRFVQEAGGVIDASAQIAGAANTLSIDHAGTMTAANTDIGGVLGPLEAMGVEFAGARAAVLGAGGAARAACAGLLRAGASVHIFNRTSERALELAQSLGDLGDISVRGEGPFDLAVQCTSAGMAHGDAPEADAAVVTGFDLGSLKAGAAVLESIYDPAETPFLRAARSRGLQVAGGLDMWGAQATGQHRFWGF